MAHSCSPPRSRLRTRPRRPRGRWRPSTPRWTWRSRAKSWRICSPETRRSAKTTRRLIGRRSLAVCRHTRSVLAARCASGSGPVSRTSRTIAIIPTSTHSSPGMRSTRVRAAHLSPLPIGLRSTDSDGDLETQTSWSLAHLAAILARLGEGDKALECIELVARHCLRDNLLTVINDWRGQGVTMFWGHGASPPTNIDANCGITAAVLEMLCYSRLGVISVFPALPTSWTRGSARGIRCKGGVSIDLDWDFGSNAARIRLESTEEQTVALRLPEYLSLEPGGLDEPPDRRERPTLRLEPGVPRTVLVMMKRAAAEA